MSLINTTISNPLIQNLSKEELKQLIKDAQNALLGKKVLSKDYTVVSDILLMSEHHSSGNEDTAPDGLSEIIADDEDWFYDLFSKCFGGNTAEDARAIDPVIEEMSAVKEVIDAFLKSAKEAMRLGVTRILRCDPDDFDYSTLEQDSEG